MLLFRLTKISSDKQSFKQVTPLYQQALDNCGYKHELSLKHPIQTNRIHHLVKTLQQTLVKAF